MNFNAANVIMFGIGAILIYSAVKDKNPKEVIQDAFRQNPSASGTNPKATVPPVAAPDTRLDPPGHSRFVGGAVTSN